jgi:hypothetical protein
LNTSQYIPVDSVAPIILESDIPDKILYFSGTGFFAYFPPYEDIFFITAKHCTIDNNNEERGALKIKYHPNQDGNEVIIFDEYFLTKSSEEEEPEDLVIYVVGSVTSENRKILKDRALRLQHQDEAKLIIDSLVQNKGKVRTVGFPSVSKEICYEEMRAVVQPRGFHGTLNGESRMENRYQVDDLNWKEGGLDGFSGAPILALCPTVGGEVLRIPIGVLLTGSAICAHFLSINVATNSIANYIANKYQPTPKSVEVEP